MYRVTSIHTTNYNVTNDKELYTVLVDYNIFEVKITSYKHFTCFIIKAKFARETIVITFQSI